MSSKNNSPLMSAKPTSLSLPPIQRQSLATLRWICELKMKTKPPATKQRFFIVSTDQLYAGGIHLGILYAPSPNTSIKPYIGVSYHQYQHDNAYFDDGVVVVKTSMPPIGKAPLAWIPSIKSVPNGRFKQVYNTTTPLNKMPPLPVLTQASTPMSPLMRGRLAKTKSKSVGTSHQIDPRNRVSLDYDYFKSEKSDGEHVQLTLSSRF